MGETTGAAAAPGAAGMPNPEGGPAEPPERDAAASEVGGDGTGGSANADGRPAAAPGPTPETGKDGAGG